MLGKCVALYVIALVGLFQVEASYKNTGTSISNPDKLAELKLKDALVTKHSQDNEVSKLHGDKPNLVRLPHINFTACIAATRDLADTEQLMYSVFAIGKVVYKGGEEFLENLKTCRSESSNDLELLLCLIDELENSGSIWEDILSDLYTLISGLENISLITDLKNCIGLSTSTRLLSG